MEPWLSRLNAGDTNGAWDLFADRYGKLVRAVIRRLVDDPDEATDAYSFVCAGLVANDFARLRQYSPDDTRRAKLSTWLVAVVRNLTVDWLRQGHGRTREHRLEPVRSRPRLMRDEPAAESDPAELAELVGLLSGALASQPAEVRLAIELFVVEGLPASEVATVVGWANAKAVYNRVYRTLEALRLELAKKGLGASDFDR